MLTAHWRVCDALALEPCPEIERIERGAGLHIPGADRRADRVAA
jgi:hypothetical protein